MTFTIKHAKTNNITDWTQAQLTAIIAGGAAPLPPAGTVLNDVTLPSDWNAGHTISGVIAVANGGTGLSSAGADNKVLTWLSGALVSTYAINQNLQTVDSPTFGGLTVNGSGSVINGSSTGGNPALVLYSDAGQNTAAKLASDATGGISYGGYFHNAAGAGYTAYLAVGGTPFASFSAGYFTDGTRIVILANGTDAVALPSGGDISTGTGTGTKLGTASNQLLSFWGASPVAQQGAGGITAGFTANASINNVFNESTFTGNIGSAAYTLNDIVAVLKTIGLLAS